MDSSYAVRSHIMLRISLLLILVGIALAISPQGTARAASLVVTSTADTDDGVCDAHCTLREAINAANTNIGPDVITFGVATPAVIYVTSQLPALTDDGTTIRGWLGDIYVQQYNPNSNYLGIEVAASNITIQGLAIAGFTVGISAPPQTRPITNLTIGTDGNAVGDEGEGNAIFGNEDYGIRIYEVYADVQGVVIAGNLIGVEPRTGNANGNGVGIQIENANAVRVGTNGDGTSDFTERNVISNSNLEGLRLQARIWDVWVAGNYIGTAPTGLSAMPNRYGIYIQTRDGQTGTITIGTNGDGRNDSIEGNLISGNEDSGIGVENAANVVIAGNLIGTNRTGTTAIPNYIGISFNDVTNLQIGMVVGQAANANLRNVISGNLWNGISVHTINTGGPVNVSIVGNYIGVGKDGTTARGNGGAGVHVYHPSNVTIAGLDTGTGKQIIAHNGAKGIVVEEGSATISKNSIYSNTGPGIDIAPLNAVNSKIPVITGFNFTYTTATIHGTLTGFTPYMKYRIEFFDNVSCDSSGYGEGKTYFYGGSVTANAQGNASFSFTMSYTVFPYNSYISATATSISSPSSTSEFSACKPT